MALMINLEDAVKVLRIEGVIEDDDQEEWFRDVLEQKCYMIMKPKSATWFDEIRTDIEHVTSIEAIGKHIVEGDLKKWLEYCRDSIIGELVLATKEQT